MSKFSNILKTLRNSHGLTQGELAKQLKMSRSTIGMYESGAREPDFETLELIADYFNVDIDYLLGRSSKTTYIPHKLEEPELTDKDERDIKKDLDSLMDKLNSKEYGPAAYDGEEIPEEDQELFAGQLELMLRRLKKINKVKYNPYKNKDKK